LPDSRFGPGGAFGIGGFQTYLTLGEAGKLAAIAFGKDIDKLSCGAT